MSKPKPPCMECPDRKAGCHSICGKYISFRKDLDDHNRKIYDKMLGDNLAKGFLAAQSEKRKP